MISLPLIDLDIVECNRGVCCFCFVCKRYIDNKSDYCHASEVGVDGESLKMEWIAKSIPFYTESLGTKICSR